MNSFCPFRYNHSSSQFQHLVLIHCPWFTWESVRHCPALNQKVRLTSWDRWNDKNEKVFSRVKDENCLLLHTNPFLVPHEWICQHDGV